MVMDVLASSAPQVGGRMLCEARKRARQAVLYDCQKGSKGYKPKAGSCVSVLVYIYIVEYTHVQAYTCNHIKGRIKPI